MKSKNTERIKTIAKKLLINYLINSKIKKENLQLLNELKRIEKEKEFQKEIKKRDEKIRLYEKTLLEHGLKLP